jgi:diguanylate cyclase (GGDEF)-like protein/PAS domain S-box-containing protein
MNKSLISYIKEKLTNANIKKLLRFILLSSSIAILTLAISTIIIEKFSYESQKQLVSDIVEIETLIKDLNNTITALIVRNASIELADNLNNLKAVSNRRVLEKNFRRDFEALQKLLISDNSMFVIEEFDELFQEFIKSDNKLFSEKQKIIMLKNELGANELILDSIVNEIINSVDSISGKIKLKASRTRIRINNDFKWEEEHDHTQHNYLLENLLGQQRRVEAASHQVQLSAVQIIQLSRKLTTTENKDELIDVRDNEIAQQLSQINISLRSLSSNLKDLPELMQDIPRVFGALDNLEKILITANRSSYNLWSEYLEVNQLIKSELIVKADRYSHGMINAIKNLEKHLELIITKHKIETENTIELSYILISFISALVVFFIISILRMLRYRINNPLKLIGDAVKDLTKGKLRSRLKNEDFANDEFLQLAESFNIFAERNEQLINEISSTRDELLENQSRLNAVLENALVGIVHLKDRKFISVNERFEEMFGYDRNNIEGLKTEILFSSQEDFESIGEEAYRNLRERDTYHNEWLVKHKDGTEFWCAISAKSIEEGKPEYGSIWLYEDITERKRTEEQLITLANYDILTSLPNRALFMDRLENYINLAERNQQMISVMFIDLDRFKQVNDSLGHDIGDKLLKSVADKLSSCVRSSDTVARLGGDEFTIIMIDIKNETIPERTASKILQSLKDPLLIDNHEIRISPSIGISMYPDNGTSVADLLRNSDAAMYHAKNLGRNNYQFYSDEMNSESLDKLTLESRLRRAIENNDFDLFFQKQFNVIKNKIVGYEALLRWRDESGQLIGPDVFIPILEDTGMIKTVGEWVIYESCRYASLLFKDNPHSIKVAVNLSARQFQDKNLITHIDSALNKYNLRPSDIELEITETVLMTGSESNQKIINELHEMGCNIVLDDFGTGYSSLAYLKQFPINSIKIDRSFIRDILTDPSDAAICNAIHAMAESLNINVVAEGVETKEQLDYLLANGFTTVQGFYYGKPVPASSLIIREDKKSNLKLIK